MKISMYWTLVAFVGTTDLVADDHNCYVNDLGKEVCIDLGNGSGPVIGGGGGGKNAIIVGPNDEKNNTANDDNNKTVTDENKSINARKFDGIKGLDSKLHF